MRRIRLVTAYDGTAYCGSQLQPNGVTVEEKLNEAVKALTGEESPVIFASRTDSGVHAAGNVCVFDTGMRMAADKFSFALNQRLPDDIRIISSDETESGWHPRKQNCRKRYTYTICNSRIPDPLMRLYTSFCYYELDADRMDRAAQCLVGEHDFAAFCSARSQAENTVRTIYEVSVKAEPLPERPGVGMRDMAGKPDGTGTPDTDGTKDMAGTKDTAGTKEGARDAGRTGRGSGRTWEDFPPKLVTISITGSGFLYNMVRILAGTLMQIGSGIRPEDDLRRILLSRNRKEGGPVAAASGLCLREIRFLPDREPLTDIDSETWSYRMEQPEDGSARITVRRADPREYEALVTRLLHRAYRDGRRPLFIRDTEDPERLQPGQQYGYYRIRETEAGDIEGTSGRTKTGDIKGISGMAETEGYFTADP